MSFTPNIPQTGQSLGNSRTQVLNNFAALRAAEAQNHMDVNDANAGKHKFIQYVVQGSDPTTAANEIARYTKVVSAVAREFLRLPSNGAVFQVSGNAPLIAASGHTFLPGGLMLQWGTQAGSSSSSVAVSFSPAFSVAPYYVNAIPVRAATSPGSDFSTVIVTGTVATTGFTIGNVGGHTIASWYWMAIGQQ